MNGSRLAGLAMLVLLTRVINAANSDIPFEFIDGLIRVEVHAPATEKPLSFLVDSGAAVSVLNAQTAERLGLRGGARVTVKGLGAMTKGRWPQPFEASVCGLTLPPRCLVVDLCAIEATCMAPIDGLIGADFFDGRVVELDFRARRMRLITPAAAASRIETFPSVLPLKKQRGVWTVEARVNDSSHQMLRVDTGCATGIHWVSAAARSATTVRHSVGLAAFAAATGTCSVELGSLIENVPATFHHERIFAGEDGLLGNEFLSRFDVVIIDGCSGRLAFGRAAASTAPSQP